MSVDASLFTVYYIDQGRTFGHTVLFYEENGKVFLADPAREKPIVVSKGFASDRRNLALLLVRGYELSSSRELRLEVQGLEASSATRVAETAPLIPAASSGTPLRPLAAPYRLKLCPGAEKGGG